MIRQARPWAELERAARWRGRLEGLAAGFVYLVVTLLIIVLAGLGGVLS